MCGVVGITGAEFGVCTVKKVSVESLMNCPPWFEKCQLNRRLDGLKEIICFCTYSQVQTSRHSYRITLSLNGLVIPKLIGASLVHWKGV